MSQRDAEVESEPVVPGDSVSVIRKEVNQDDVVPVEPVESIPELNYQLHLCQMMTMLMELDSLIKPIYQEIMRLIQKFLLRRLQT